jgi:DNA polymerase-3 subunit beta
MKFECATDQFFSGVSLASRFVQRGGHLPVLSSILIAAESGALVLRATNLECGIEISIGAKVGQAGTIAAPAGVLLGFLSNTRSKTVSAVLEGGVLKLKTERASASVKTVPHDDFPTLPRVSAEHSFSVKAAEFSQGLRSVLQCASNSAIKPELQSVLIFGEAGKLSCVATDSFRLAEKTIPLRSRGDIPSLLLPARNAAELVRILDGAGGEVQVYYNENQISVQVDNVYYTSRLIDGAFPNYRQIVPKEFATEAVVLREDLSQALRGLSVFSDKFLQVALSVDPKGKMVELSSRNADVGEEECTLKAAVSGEGVKMTFNSRYLGDGLTPISGESVRLQVPASPCSYATLRMIRTCIWRCR